MKKNFKLDEVMSLLKNLPENEANLIVEELYSKLSSKEAVDNSVYSLSKKATFACRHCGSVHFIKNGKDRHGHTRYFCKDCGKTFSDTTNTVVSGTHKVQTHGKHISVPCSTAVPLKNVLLSAT